MAWCASTTASCPASRRSRPPCSAASARCRARCIGGLLIGIIETLWAEYVSSAYKDVAAFSILAIVMIFLPQGILGRPDVEKV